MINTKSLLFFALLISAISLRSQVTLKGTVMTDNETELEGKIRVENVTNRTATMPNVMGKFSIPVNLGDTLFIKSDLYLERKIIISQDLFDKQQLFVYLTPEVIYLDNFSVGKLNLSKNLEDNIRNREVLDPDALLYNNLGLDPNMKDHEPRENVRELHFLEVFPLTMNIGRVYSEFSGDRRRNKSMYLYEDNEKIINGIIDYFGEDNIVKEFKIPRHKIRDFTVFLLTFPNTRQMYKTTNFGGISILMEEKSPEFIERLKKADDYILEADLSEPEDE